MYKRSLEYGYYVGLIYPGKQGLRCPATLFVVTDVEVSVSRNGGDLFLKRAFFKRARFFIYDPKLFSGTGSVE